MFSAYFIILNIFLNIQNILERVHPRMWVNSGLIGYMHRYSVNLVVCSCYFDSIHSNFALNTQHIQGTMGVNQASLGSSSFGKTDSQFAKKPPLYFL